MGRRPTEPAQLTLHLEPSPTYPFAVFNLGTEAARWSTSRRPIHRRSSDARDEGCRPWTTIRTFPAARGTLELHPFLSLSRPSLQVTETLAPVKFLAVATGHRKPQRQALELRLNA
jgi:hypothetical protein